MSSMTSPNLIVGRTCRLSEAIGGLLREKGVKGCFASCGFDVDSMLRGLKEGGLPCWPVGDDGEGQAARCAWAVTGQLQVVVSSGTVPIGINNSPILVLKLEQATDSPATPLSIFSSVNSIGSNDDGDVRVVTIPTTLVSAPFTIPIDFTMPQRMVRCDRTSPLSKGQGQSGDHLMSCLGESVPEAALFIADDAEIVAKGIEHLKPTQDILKVPSDTVHHNLSGTVQCKDRTVVALVSDVSLMKYGLQLSFSSLARNFIIVSLPSQSRSSSLEHLASALNFKFLETDDPSLLSSSLASFNGSLLVSWTRFTSVPLPPPSHLMNAICNVLLEAGVKHIFTPTQGDRHVTVHGATHAAKGAAETSSASAVICTLEDASPLPPSKPVVQVILSGEDPACVEASFNAKQTLAVTEPSRLSSALRHAVAISLVPPSAPVTLILPREMLPCGEPTDFSWPSLRDPVKDLSRLTELKLLCSTTPTRLHISCPLPASLQPHVEAIVKAFDMTVTTAAVAKGSYPETASNWLWSGPVVPPELQAALVPCRAWVVLGDGVPPSPAPHVLTISPSPQADLLCDVETFVTELALVSADQKPKAPVAADLISKCHVKMSSRLAALRGEGGPTPSFIFAKLQEILPQDTVYCLDSGMSYEAGVENLRVGSTDDVIIPTDPKMRGVALPAAVGLTCRTQKTAVVVLGDGCFLESYSALVTAAAMKAPMIIVLLRDGERALLSVQYKLAGRRVPEHNDLPPFDVSHAAALCRVAYRKVTKDDMGAAVAWARERTEAGEGPILLEIRPAPEVPFSVIASLLPQNNIEASTEPLPVKQTASSPKNVTLNKVQRLVRATVEPGDFYTPIVRQRDTSFAVNELQTRTASNKLAIWDILCHARDTAPQHTAYVEGDVKATYEKFYSRVCHVADYLQNVAKVQPGERVGVMTPNIYQCLEAHYAIAGGARGVVLNLNQRLSAEELAYVLDDSEPVWIVTASRFAPLIIDAVKKSKKTVKGLLWVGDVPSAVEASIMHHDFDAVANGEGTELDVEGFTPPPGDPSDGCEMYYTSGTTGRPKGVILTQKIVVLHALGCMIEHRHHSRDVWGHIAPMFHLVDAYGMFSITWVCGTQAFVPVFSAANSLSAIEDYGITVTNMASTMATLLLTHPGVEKRNFRSLEMISCGGAPLSRETTLRAIAVFGCEIFQSYGMTECCGKISMSLLNTPEVQKLPPHEQVDLVCSSGKPFGLPGFEVRVVGNDGNVVAPMSGDVGEVQIKGPTVFSGYHNRPEATAESFDGDWFKTGDLATVGAHGYLNVCDRKKDMILTGGENVYSVEVERVLADHEEVKYVGVYAIPNSLLGEVVKAVVELHPGATITSTKLRRHCEKFLADYKVPRELEIVSNMPLTGTGKVAKAELKAREAAKREEKEKARKERSTPAPAPEAQPPLTNEVLQNDTYHVTWKPESVGRGNNITGHWVVLSDSDGIGNLLSEQLASESANIATLDYSACDPYSVDTFKNVLRKDTEGVVFMWGLNCSPVGGEKVTSDVTQQVHSSLRSLLALLQAVLSVKTSMNIWIVTRGAEVDIPGVPSQCTPVHASQQALWGIARVIPAERSGLRCRVVDLCPGDSSVEANASSLRSEISAPDGGASHGESAWRARRRYVPRLQLLSMPFSESPSLRSDATYIITGGLGGLGRNLTRYMVTSWGAKHLVLVSRRKPEDSVAKELQDLEARFSATIRVESADISKVESTEAFFARVASSMPPIKGVFHLAGVVDDGKIEDQTWDRFSKVLVPKVDGSINLHVAAEKLKLDLDHFVLFSSIYGVLGYRELTHYAAANAFQDGLCLARRRMGLPALAVSWGTWADAGMASRFGSGFESYWKGLGMEFVPLEGGMQTLGSLCMQAAGCMQAAAADRVVHAGVFPASWERYTKQRRQLGPHPLCVDLVESPAQAVTASTENLPPLVKEMLQVPPERRQKAMETSIIRMILELKDESDDEEVDPELPVVDIGLTSMHVIDLTVQLGEVTGIEDISPTLVYECVTIAAVAEKILEDIRDHLDKASSAAPQSAVDPNATQLVQRLQGASPADRPKILQDAVIELTKELLDDEDVEIDVTAPVVELGLTSMHVVDMTQQLIDITGLDDLSPTFIYECVTIAAAVAQLLEELPLSNAVQATPQPTSSPVKEAPDQSMGPLAVVGMGCRLPGDANTPSEFWENLEAERNCIVPTPGDRPSNGRPSGYLSAKTIKNFDSQAFNISDVEAACMDPQQRLLLQVAKEAFEDAGIKVEELQDRRVGVFVGVSNVEYGALCMKAVQEGNMDPLPYCGTSWHLSIAANRISYLLDLTGPSVSMDTACSSSLTAMDFAVKALRAGSCSMALVCGANVQLVETWSDCFEIAGMLSPTYSCKFGDNSADGYVRGEGVGAVLVKPLQDAVADGNNIYAEVVGTAINQDARSNGLTAPNPAAQEALLKAAYTGMDTNDVMYIEAHGTGTRLGDPIEMAALGRVLGAPKDMPPRQQPLLMGSVKSCIGHLECAAGIASIIKTCLILSHGRIPPSLHFSTPNTVVRFEASGLEVVGQSKGTRPLPRPASSRQPMIGVSGFGFGGTNGHCVFRQHEQKPIDKTALKHSGRCLVPISAHSEESLRLTAERWITVAKDANQTGYPTLADFARTAALYRYHGTREKPVRATVVAADMSELTTRLTALATSSTHPCAPSNRAVSTAPKVAFVFTGQGSQTVGMGRGLYETSHAFAKAMESCDEILATKNILPEGYTLLGTLYGPPEACETAMSNAGFLQPTLLSVEYALSRLIEDELMVQPAVVMGHSLGEITACIASGVLTLEDALVLAAGRGAAMAAVPAGQGGMAAVRLDKKELDEFLKECAPKVTVAAVNAPGSSVISGPLADLKIAIAALKENGKKVRQLTVSHGFHSMQIEDALPRLRDVASKLRPRPVKEGIVAISNVTGTVQTKTPDAQYWVDHARGAVLFMSGVEAALEQGVNVFLELGPQPHLSVQINGVIATHNKPVAVVSTLKAGEDESELLGITAGALHNAGVPLQWDRLCGSGTRVQLPTTAFAGAELWSDALQPTRRQLLAQIQERDPAGVVFNTEWKEHPVSSNIDLRSRAVLLISDNGSHKALIPELKSVGCLVSKVVAPPTELSSQKVTAALEERPRWHCVVFSCSAPDILHCTTALLRVVQAAQRLKRVDRILVLTTGVCSDKPGENGLDISVACQAGLWGFVKSARLEMTNGPLMQCCDKDPSNTDVAKSVVAEISAEHFGTDNVRLAGGGFGRRIERVAEVKRVTKHKYTPPPAGPIILTGGTGALGLQLSDWLIRRGARKLVLLSRSGKIASSNSGLWDALTVTSERLGAEVKLQKCDVSDPKQAKDMINEYAADLPHGGLVHCAGVLDDGLLRSQSEERFDKVITPKVGGLLHIFKAMMARTVRPTLFLLFSSVTSLMGNIGQTNYGAANSMLDSIARQLRAAEFPCTSVQWGPWGGHGMAAFMDESEGVNTVWKPLTPALGWGALDVALAQGADPVLCVSGFKWNNLREFMSTSPWNENYFGDMVEMYTEEIDSSVRNESVEILEEEESATPVSESSVAEKLKELLSRYVKQGSQLLPTTELVSLGLDSVDMTATAQDISKKFGIKAGPMLVMEASNLAELTTTITAELVKGSSHKAPAVKKVKRAEPRSKNPLSPAAAAEQEALSEADILAGVIDILSKFAKGVLGITMGTTLVSLSLDSVDMTAIAQEVGKRFSIKAGPMLVMEAEIVADLVASIQEAGASRTTEKKASKQVKKVSSKNGFTAPQATLTPETCLEQLKQVLLKFAKSGAAIEPSTELVALSLDSVDMTAIAQEVARKFNVKVGPMFVMESETVDDLCQGVIAKQPVASPAASTSQSARRATPKAAEANVDLQDENADLKCDNEILKRQAHIHSKDAPWIVEVTFKVLPLIFSLLGFFVATLLASLASRPMEAVIDLTNQECGKNLGFFLSPNVYFELAYRIALFLVLFLLLGCVYGVLLKWIVIGRFKAHTWDSHSAYALKRAIVHTYLEMLHKMLGALEETEFLVWFYRALGADIGHNVLLPWTLQLDYDLLHIGDHVIMGSRTGAQTSYCHDGITVTSRHTWIGAGTSICRAAYVMPGAQLGQAVVVCARSTAQGSVMSGATVYEDKVLPPGEQPPEDTGVCTYLRTKDGTTLASIFMQFVAVVFFLITMVISFTFSVSWSLWGLAMIPGMCNNGTQATPILSMGNVNLYLTAEGAVVLLFTLWVLGGTTSILALICKWALIGRVKPGTEKVTKTMILRFWFVKQMINISESLFIMSYFRYTPMMWAWYRLLGMKVPCSAIMSAFVNVIPDLVSSDEDAYFGYNPQIPCIACDPADGVVTFVRTHVGARGFIGPDAIMLPGSNIETRGAVSASGIVGAGKTIRTGTTQIGPRVTVAFRPEAQLSNNALFQVYLTIFALWRAVWDMSFSMVSIAISLAAMLAVHEAGMGWSFSLGIAVASIAFFFTVVVSTLQGLISIASKWMLLGKVKEGVHHQWRSFYHARWVNCLAVSMKAVDNMKTMYRGTVVMRMYHRMRGGKVGPGAKLMCAPRSPEAELVEFKEGVYLSEESGHIYAHNFATGDLHFEKSIIGAGVRLPTTTHVVPGATINDGVTTGPGTLILPRGMEDKCEILMGNPCKPCVYESETYTRQGNGVIPLDFTLAKYNKALLRSADSEDTENCDGEIHEVQRKRSSYRRRSALQASLLHGDGGVEPSDDEEMEVLQLTSADANEVTYSAAL